MPGYGLLSGLVYNSTQPTEVLRTSSKVCSVHVCVRFACIQLQGSCPNAYRRTNFSTAGDTHITAIIDEKLISNTRECCVRLRSPSGNGYPCCSRCAASLTHSIGALYPGPKLTPCRHVQALSMLFLAACNLLLL